MAQEWADGCEWKHGNPERDPKPFPAIGQNLYMTTGELMLISFVVLCLNDF